MDGARPTVYIWCRGQAGIGMDQYFSDLKRSHTMDAAEKMRNILEAVSAVADCVQALHTAGIAHLDVKPANFFVECNSEGEIEPGKLTLFDINSICEKPGDAAYVLGTPGFSAPEVRNGRVEFGRRKNVRSEISDPAVVIQKLLYDYPLYSALERRKKKTEAGLSEKDLLAERLPGDGETESRPSVKEVSEDRSIRDLNILVVGRDPYGRKFMDICLEIGQMHGVRLQITAASTDPAEEKALYLKDRPAFTQFVQVDDRLPFYRENIYGVVRFTDTAKLQEPSELKKYHYIFIALDEDGICRRVAMEMEEKLGVIRHRCVVCYLQREVSDRIRGAVPVYVNRPVTFRNIEDNIGEMAFHTHIIWNGQMDTNLAKERRRFFESEDAADRYNRIASLYYAVSIKYKLHSIGIRESDSDAAAARFAEQVLARRDSDEGAHRMFHRLVALEHRRWVMEKVMDGWTAPPRDAANGELQLKDAITRASVKDMGRKIHPCLVPGTEETPLEDPSFTRERWDMGDISGLDELDRMSVELHRCFGREADLIRQGYFAEGGNLTDIRSILPPNDPALMWALDSFQENLNGVLEGRESCSRRYGASESAFLAACGRLPESDRRIIEQRLAALRHVLFPVIESNLYRNYKKYDEDLIEKIPFILTWRSNPSLAAWMEDGSGGSILSNVTAAAALIPGEVTYLYFCRGEAQAERLPQLLGRICDWYFARNLTCGIHLVAAFQENIGGEVRERLGERLRRLKGATAARGKDGRFEGMDAAFDAEDETEARERFAEYLAENREYIDLFDIGTSGKNLPQRECKERTEEIRGSEIVREITDKMPLTVDYLKKTGIPYFHYEWETGKFDLCKGCEYLRYLDRKISLSVEELSALLGGTLTKSKMPEFGSDHETLWDIYSGSSAVWNRMVPALRKYDRSHRTVAVFCPGAAKSGERVNLTYCLPDYCFATARKLLDRLVDGGILGDGSGLDMRTSDTCRLRLACAPEYREALDRVFAIPQRLLPYYNMDVVKQENECLEIRYENLTVQNLKMQENEFEAMADLLRKLGTAGFLQGVSVKECEKEASFTYLAPRIKWLLTTDGAMLKVHACYEAAKTGEYDIVSFGTRLEWEEDNAGTCGKIRKDENYDLRAENPGSWEGGEGDGKIRESSRRITADFVLIKGFRSFWIRSAEEDAELGRRFKETFGEAATVVRLK